MTDEETPSNVIQFPKKSKIPTPKEVSQNLFAQQEDEIQIIVDMIFSNLIENLEAVGFPLDDPQIIKEFRFVLESVIALVHKYYGISHTYHDMARHSFTIVDGDLVFTNPKFERKIEIESKD